jgi:hypothetical protein
MNDGQAAPRTALAPTGWHDPRRSADKGDGVDDRREGCADEGSRREPAIRRITHERVAEYS